MVYLPTLLVRTAPQLGASVVDFPHATPLAIAEVEHHAVRFTGQETGLILTSQNAVPAIVPAIVSAIVSAVVPAVASTVVPTSLPIYAVGEKTAAAARAGGLNVVYVGQGTGAEMLQQLPPTPLAHVHGNTADVGWHAPHIAAHCGYTVHWLPALPPAVVALVNTARHLQVLLWSAKSAAHLQKLLQQATLDLGALTAVCLSPQVAQAAPLFGTHRVAYAPTTAAMQQAAMQTD